MGKRTFTARVAGKGYEIPSTMGVLTEAEEASGVSLMAALAEGRFGRFLQGVIFVGMKRLNVTEIDGEPLTYGSIEESCDFAEAQANYIAFMQALVPDLEPTPKNAKPRSPKS